MTEAQLQGSVLDLARLLGLLAYHPYDSRRSAPGFPDLVLVGPGGVLFGELKSAAGTLSPEQARWKWALLAAGADWRLWRPQDWFSGAITAELDRLAAR